MAGEEVLLRVRNLCQYFKLDGKTINKAVDDVSFDIYKGEVFGLVGESGCGKTTTGRSIIGLYDITSGSIYFKGERICAGTKGWKDTIAAAQKEKRACTDKAKAKRLEEQIEAYKEEIQSARRDQKRADKKRIREIQMIFQDPMASLDPRMTVRDSIAEGLVIKGIRDKDFINKKVYEMLDTVGLPRGYAHRYPHEFSGGQRQRIGIARSLIMEPSLIIADEPISALDVSIRAQIINLLENLRRERGITILFIAHDLAVVKYFCDRVGVMYRGKLVELADSDELFANPLHPYTRSLLSAIPKPDPFSEKNRKRIPYTPNPTQGKRVFREVGPGHFVLWDDGELAQFRKENG